MGDELGGHIVTGHVDSVGEVIDVRPEGDSVGSTFASGRAGARDRSERLDLARRCVPDRQWRPGQRGRTQFSVNVIPHTAQQTTLGELASGQQLNVEIDVIARYIERMIAARTQ